MEGKAGESVFVWEMKKKCADVDVYSLKSCMIHRSFQDSRSLAMVLFGLWRVHNIQGTALALALAKSLCSPTWYNGLLEPLMMFCFESAASSRIQHIHGLEFPHVARK